jgi:hypothetical protein
MNKHVRVECDVLNLVNAGRSGMHWKLMPLPTFLIGIRGSALTGYPIRYCGDNGNLCQQDPDGLGGWIEAD